MAFNSQACKNSISTATGFDLNNEHCRTSETIVAIVDGTINHLKAKAKIIVNSHAGGVYPIVGIVESSLANEIMALMPNFNFSGEHSKADVLPKAVAKAVSTVVMTKGKVAIPTDYKGNCRIDYIVSSDLSNAIESSLIAAGFKTNNTHARTSPMRDAIANELARALSSDAWFTVNGESGGTFFML